MYNWNSMLQKSGHGSPSAIAGTWHTEIKLFHHTSNIKYSHFHWHMWRQINFITLSFTHLNIHTSVYYVKSHQVLTLPFSQLSEYINLTTLSFTQCEAILNIHTSLQEQINFITFPFTYVTPHLIFPLSLTHVKSSKRLKNAITYSSNQYFIPEPNGPRPFKLSKATRIEYRIHRIERER